MKQNIRMYNEEITDEEVKEAAQFVQANTFIEKLPEQYETEVVERGAAFSSGQRQLIAFARTIATNPKVLVLDEATANIDTETEDAIQTALQQMRKRENDYSHCAPVIYNSRCRPNFRYA